jgi:hypothetical protein
MRGFAQLDWPTTATWVLFALAAAVAVAAQTFPHARAAFHRWRLDWRLARNRWIQREELREYDSAIGDELAPLDAVDVARQALVAAALAALPAWLGERHLEHWWMGAVLGFGLSGLLYTAWRRLNDPPELPDDDVVGPSLYVPREAVIGFGSAIVIVLAVLLLAFRYL